MDKIFLPSPEYIRLIKESVGVHNGYTSFEGYPESRAYIANRIS
jgi:hypothetical protein